MVLAGGDVPELDCEVARGGGEDVVGRGVKQDLPDFSIASWLVWHCNYSLPLQKHGSWVKIEIERGVAYLVWPPSLLTGDTSGMTSASV